MGISRPAWALRLLRSGLPDLTVPDLASTSGGVPTFGEAYGA
jgi:hypothetical protein